MFMSNSGLFILSKPSGPTSHDAVLWARRSLKTKKIGHCGTLDPMASGLLLLVVGDAVKLQNTFVLEKKSYTGCFRLGLSTDTNDITGKQLPSTCTGQPISQKDLEKTCRDFIGPQQQRVPMFSAVKVNGQRLYELARKGILVDLPVKSVEIFSFHLKSYSYPDAQFSVECSKGMYVRSLVRDIGEKLGCGATLVSLCRESIGAYSIKNAYKWDGSKNMSLGNIADSFISMEKL